MRIEKEMGYVKEKELLAEVAGIDFVNKIYYLLSEDNEYHTANIDDVEILKKLFVLHDDTVFDKDVLTDEDGLMYLIELHEGDDYQSGNYDYIKLHLINKNLEKKVSGSKMRITESVIKTLEKSMSRYSNYYELLKEKVNNPSFNIKVVKDFDGKNYTYYYACNNKDNEEIDLIKVIFIGHRLLEEEYYERHTFSYEEYNNLVKMGDIIVSSPAELMNYVTGATNSGCEKENCCGNKDDCEKDNSSKGINFTSFSADGFAGSYDSTFTPSLEDNKEKVEEDVCEDCGRPSELCDCDLW